MGNLIQGIEEQTDRLRKIIRNRDVLFNKKPAEWHDSEAGFDFTVITSELEDQVTALIIVVKELKDIANKVNLFNSTYKL